MKQNKTLALFSYDWDRIELQKLAQKWPYTHAGFDLFSFPSNARLIWFDMERFSTIAALRARAQKASAVLSNHEQFGALCAALVAEKTGLPGTSVNAVLVCQHKLYARQVLEQVAPEANIPFSRLEMDFNADIPVDINYPTFVKPIKAAFSVLAKTVHNSQELYEHTRFSKRELWIVRHLVEPFEKVIRQRLPEAGTAHSFLLEKKMHGRQYCLDGYCIDGELRSLGIVDAIMYPGSDAFMRWDYPSLLPEKHIQGAEAVAKKFLQAVGFDHGFFNMEFLIDEQTGQLKVIEFNPRMASQFSDLYERVDGINPHEMVLALAHGIDPQELPKKEPTANCAASFVYRSLDPNADVTMPTAIQEQAFKAGFPDGLLLKFPKSPGEIKQDFKWLDSYRYGIVHLGAENPDALRARCDEASALLGWMSPYADHVIASTDDLPEEEAGWTPTPVLENTSS